MAVCEQAEAASPGRISGSAIRIGVAVGVAAGITLGVHRILVGAPLHCVIMAACAVITIAPTAPCGRRCR